MCRRSELDMLPVIALNVLAGLLAASAAGNQIFVTLKKGEEYPPKVVEAR